MTAPLVRPASPADRPLVEQLWQLYSHDLSEFRATFPDATGLFRAGRLPCYLDDLDDSGRSVHVVEQAGRPAGFAMVRGSTTAATCSVSSSSSGPHGASASAARRR